MDAADARATYRRLSRLRWRAKWKVLHYSGARVMDRDAWRYLLWDPEVESHTYEIANQDELAAFCADAFGIGREVARELVAETRAEPALTSELRRRTRWAFDLKTQPPLALRTIWWVLVRARRPQLVVETGIYEGLGSLVVLAALERNGDGGRLLSVDADRRSGRLVPERLHRSWERVTGRTSDVLEPALRGRRVDILLQDTPHTREIQSLEFGLALQHAAPQCTLVDGSGGRVPVLRELAAEHGVDVHRFVPVPVRHPYRSPGLELATFER